MKKAMLTMAVVALMGSNVAVAAPAKAMMCAACHGADGKATNPVYPSLAGQHAEYLESALKMYRDGQRNDPMMSGMAKGLSDADIKEIAQYYADM
jgi:cytochrome c553